YWPTSETLREVAVASLSVTAAKQARRPRRACFSTVVCRARSPASRTETLPIEDHHATSYQDPMKNLVEVGSRSAQSARRLAWSALQWAATPQISARILSREGSSAMPVASPSSIAAPNASSLFLLVR